MELRHPAYTRIIAICGFLLSLCLSGVAAFFTWRLSQVERDIRYASLAATLAITCFWFAVSHLYRMRLFFYVYTLTPDRLTCYNPFSRRTGTIHSGESVYMTSGLLNEGNRHPHQFEHVWRLVSRTGTEIVFSEVLSVSPQIQQLFHPLLRE